jgi:porphobilinogen synthase
VREALLDIAEGADIVMVKPAMAFLDVLREVRDACACPSGPTRCRASTR